MSPRPEAVENIPAIEGKTTNEELIERLPEFAHQFDILWGHFANTTIGFAGGGPVPWELGPKWAKEVADSLKGCTIPVLSEDEDWGKMVTLLHDLSSTFLVYFDKNQLGQLSPLELTMSLIRMGRDGPDLIRIFEGRGYIQRNLPFHYDDRGDIR